MKVGGGDEVHITSPCFLDPGILATVTNEEGQSHLVFSCRGYILIEGYKKDGTAKKLYATRLPQGDEQNHEAPRIKEIVRYPRLFEELEKQKIKPLSTTGKLSILFRGEVAIRRQNAEGLLLNEFWIITQDQKNLLLQGLPIG